MTARINVMTHFHSAVVVLACLAQMYEIVYAAIPVGPSQGSYFGITPSDSAFQSGDFVGYESAKLGITPAVFVHFFDLPLDDGNAASLNGFLAQVQPAICTSYHPV